MKAKLITTGFHVWDQKPGDYAIVDEDHPNIKGIMAILPCGHFFYDSEGKWQYENKEDENKITVSPSIFCSPQIPCWHGFLRNGEFVEV